MTNREYLLLKLDKFNVTPDEVEVMLMESEVEGGDQVSDFKLMKTIMYNKLPELIAGLSDVSEGGYSIKRNYAGLKEWYSWLANDLGLPDVFTQTPTITGAKPW